MTPQDIVSTTRDPEEPDLAAGVVGIEGAAEPQKISEAITEAGYMVEGQVA